MEALNNVWVVIVLIGAVIGIGIWLFNKMYSNIEKLTETVNDSLMLVREMKKDIDHEREHRIENENRLKILERKVFKVIYE